MAKAKKEKPVKFDPNIMDYYAIFGLVRGTDNKTLLSQLRKKQGEIKQMMSAGALNKSEAMQDLLEQDKLVTAAIRIFKSPEKLEEYNAQLDAAYASGAINTQAQEEAKSKLEEIERLFMKGNYAAVIKLCRTSLMESGANAKMYDWLAKSYYMSDKGPEALAVVDEYINAFPTDENALDLGVRYNILIDENFNKAQEYANIITENHPGSSLAAADQIYIHVAQRNKDMAFKEIDQYIADNPTDMEFRHIIAYDIIGACSSLYKMDNYQGVEIAYMTSEEDYKYCKELSDKAVSIYNNDEIRRFSEATNHMGEVVFNEDNKPSLKWLGIAGAVYILGGLMMKDSGGILMTLIGFALGGVCIYLAYNLYKVSMRPYWQIYKYELTGEREPKEELYIKIGNIVAGYMRWSFKAALKLFELAGRP